MNRFVFATHSFTYSVAEAAEAAEALTLGLTTVANWARLPWPPLPPC